jgi:hypothetical protein
MDQALRKLIIWTAALTLVFFTMVAPAFGKGISHPQDEYTPRTEGGGRPCLIKVTASGTYINANTLSYISGGKREVDGDSGVTYYFGRYNSVRVLTPDPQGVIDRVVAEIERKCK